MAVVRVHKNENYTVLSNYHFKEKGMSLKAKGLLSLMLSLPDDWDYSVAGLVTLSKDGKDSVNAALKELEAFGYLKRTQATDESGKFSGYNYEIFENPQTSKPFTENPSTAKPKTENPPQLSKKESNTKKSKTKKLNTEGEEEGRKKEKKKAPTGYDEIIKNKISNDEVKKTLYEFIKMRQFIKKPLTDFALTKLIEKLEKISNDIQTQIAVLEYSIMNNYPDIYPPKAAAAEKKQETGFDLDEFFEAATIKSESGAALYDTEGNEIEADDVLQYIKGNVLLSENQVSDLLEKIGLEAFDYYVAKLSAYIEENGPIKSHYQTILKWVKQDSAVAR